MKRAATVTVTTILAMVCGVERAFADAPPPSYGPPPPSYGPPPAGYVQMEPPMKHRSPAMMISGGIMTGVGATAGLFGALLITTCPGCTGESLQTLFVGIGLVGLGVIHVAVGIPLLAVGASKVPVNPMEAHRRSWTGAPGGAGWMWRF